MDQPVRRGAASGSKACEQHGWCLSEGAAVQAPSSLASGEAARPGQELHALVRTVEAQIIPRLVLAHRDEHGRPIDFGGMMHASEEDLEQCVRLLIDSGVESICAFAEGVHARGIALESVYLEVFAPAARRLGELWESDDCSFTDVTIALGRLQQVLRRFGSRFRGDGFVGEPWRRALFAAAPGEQHTFGLSMVVQFFLRAGWDASLLPAPAGEELVQLVQRDRVALVGLTMSCESRAPALKALISRLRRLSGNPELRVIVGGNPFNDRPALAAEVGADATAIDAHRAVDIAQQLILSAPSLCN